MFQKTTVKYAWMGGLFGLCFPVFALLFNIWWNEYAFTFENIGLLHQQQPIHWIIDSAPFILSLFAWFAGVRQEEIETLHATQSKQLDKTDRLQKTILNNATSIILTTDLTGQIQSYNPAAKRLLNRQNDAEWKGKNITQLISKRDLEKEAQKLSKHLKNAISPDFQIFSAGLSLGIPFYEAEFHMIRKGGAPFPVLLSVTPLHGTGNEQTGYLFMSMDITQLKQSESKLADTVVELQKANQELDRFLYLASHDLRTPLRGISTLTDFIREDLGGELSDETHHNFQMIKNRVVRMHKLLEAIQEYANAGKSHLDQPEFFSLDRKLKKVITKLNPSEGFSIQYKTGGPHLRYDRKKMELILLHLLKNALIHHHASTGRIQIDWKVIEETDLEITISDDGPGIDKRYQEKVFEVFQALNPREKNDTVGVGLAIVKRIIEESGGKINLNSAPGQGTHLTFCIPGIITSELAPSPQMLEP